ncbi:MAG: T9SS type A sorting domain-containing protein [Muribaculaceae bacterium]|nr:T9SS type A sorting domain-containing protein [Muribaculaceae bacterium]
MKKFLLPKILLLLLGMTFALGANAQDYYKMVVWEKGGAVVGTYELTYTPKVTFTETEMIVTTSIADVYYYNLPNMWKITYEEYEPTGLDNILADANAMKFNGSAIVFPALEAGSNITVYAVNGTMVLNKTVSSAGEYAFPISSLSQGVYLVNVNGKTYKIVKK